jgi:tRNA threonylcarbamoyladenosine modification (KEOPS) complex  Pcc1 subunit
MNPSKSVFSIQSTIKFTFENSDLCSYCYNTFIPELNGFESTRSNVLMEKKDKSLLFTVQSNDITAFRASVNEIIGFGKIIDQSIHISENF